jgi:hypothetical protein
MTRRKDARLNRLDEHFVMPEDPPSVTLEQPASCQYLPVQPDSRSQGTFVLAEATAIRVLVKLYNWTWLQAGVLRRPGA